MTISDKLRSLSLLFVLDGSSWVVDGDTFVLKHERVRVWGLDCPERNQKDGPRATYEARLLLEGNEILLHRQGKDRWGRTVARVIVRRTSPNESFTFDFACAMIQKGVCEEYEHFSKGYYKRCKP